MGGRGWNAIQSAKQLEAGIAAVRRRLMVSGSPVSRDAAVPRQDLPCRIKAYVGRRTLPPFIGAPRMQSANGTSLPLNSLLA
jgi:hypothetical protein